MVINMPCVKNLKTGAQRFVTHSNFLLKFSPTTVCENRSQTRKKLAEPTTTKQENVTDVACQSQPKKYVNRSSRRKRGMVSNRLFKIPDFFCIFPMNFAMATLDLKEMGKFLWEVREKKFAQLAASVQFCQTESQKGRPFFPTFPKEFSHFLQT